MLDVFDRQRWTISADDHDGPSTDIELLCEECSQALAQVAISLRREEEAIGHERGKIRLVFGWSEGQHTLRLHGGETLERIQQESLRRPRTPGSIAGCQARLDPTRYRPLGKQAQCFLFSHLSSYKLSHLSSYKLCPGARSRATECQRNWLPSSRNYGH